jgi:integrase
MASRKKNGSGYTYKVGNSYRTRIKVKGLVITASAKSVQESKRLAKERVKTLPTARLTSKAEYRRLRLSEFLTEWLETEHKFNIAYSTHLRYLSLLKCHISPLIGNYYLDQVTPQLISNFLTEMRLAGLSARSMQQARVLLSIGFKAAEDQGLINNNPVLKVRNPQNREIQITPLSIDEVKRLLSTFMGTYLSARLHMALVCGLRQGEALGLQWSDVDFGRGILQVQKQMQFIDRKHAFVELKTFRSRRVIALTDETIEALRFHKGLQVGVSPNPNNRWAEAGLIFCNSDGSPINAKTDYKEWQKALKLCGIAPRRLHDARHTAATLMYSQGIGIETISRALGHSSSAITSRLYVHSAEEPLRSAADLMNKLLLEKRT